MGLDTTHDAWHGPYSAFSRFRQLVAKTIGVDLMDMEGFESMKPVSGDRPSWEMEEIPIPWEALGDEPLIPFLCHSDCDGDISPEDCAGIADRMEALRPEFEKQLRMLGAKYGAQHRDATEDRMLQRYDQWVSGCRAAAGAGERLEFR